MRKLRRLLYGLLILSLLFLAGSGLVFFKLQASLPLMEGETQVTGLHSPVKVTFDRFGLPTIMAPTRREAFLALGYITARDRLFQMDLLRRHSSGRLAEIIGQAALQHDIRQRILGFQETANAVVSSLPFEQRQILQAYAQGVNAFIKQMETPPWEFLATRYRPELWTPRDSILVSLSMFQRLNRDVRDERMLSVMAATLPAEVVAFLTPDTDRYTQVLWGKPQSYRPIQPVPAKAIARLLHATPTPQKQLTGLVNTRDSSVGSNNWVVAPKKTKDGRALLANDMHLPLSVPNIWYRAMLHYGEAMLAGLTLPGIPLLIAGSNGHVAWGFTNVLADLLDLVSIEIHPDRPHQYRTPQGWRRFGVRPETIQVKGASEVQFEVKTTLWGPLAQNPLLGQPVAIHWAALDPTTTNLGLLEMDKARTVADGIQVMNHSGGPPMNALLADAQGHIAWTYMGTFPVRRGFKGDISQSWADGQKGWQGYVPPHELPQVVDPPSGFLATANNRTLGQDYPHLVGHNFASGYRAYRIRQRLQTMDNITEEAMLELQLDTRTQFYDFYQKLALKVLKKTDETPFLSEIRQYLKAWNGKADEESLGLGLLVAFRNTLADSVFTPILATSRERDPEFVYSWFKLDVPLRRLLTAQIPETLPDPKYPDWPSFIRAKLLQSAHQLKEKYQVKQWQALTWKRINQFQISHPFSDSIPGMGRFLDMPQEGLPGCRLCVRLIHGENEGASERMVLAPSKLGDASLHMPGGQSGHPLSPHYQDQHPYWVEGLPLTFLPAHAAHKLTLVPEETTPSL